MYVRESRDLAPLIQVLVMLVPSGSIESAGSSLPEVLMDIYIYIYMLSYLD